MNKRRLGGFVAKKQGQIFEEVFQKRSESNCVVIRIPDGAKRIGKNILIQVKTPFDIILIHKSSKQVVFLDLKTTKLKSWPIKNNTPHQINKLKEISETGHVAGYVVYFREDEKLIFYSVQELIKQRDRASLTPEDGVFLGSLLNFDIGHIFAQRLLSE